MRTVHIEICENCKEHKWYAHHSQNKFVNRYQQGIISFFCCLILSIFLVKYHLMK